jgi:ABC-type multidrug transport system fused ATPase/permease subunit
LRVGATLKALRPYLAEFPGRVAFALVLMMAAKGAGVWLPQILKRLVDSLTPADGKVLIVPAALLLAYGAARFANVLLGELRDVVFGRVAERAQRRSALRVFEHLHALDLEFHLSRRTGGLARDIERGSKSHSSPAFCGRNTTSVSPRSPSFRWWLMSAFRSGSPNGVRASCAKPTSPTRAPIRVRWIAC